MAGKVSNLVYSPTHDLTVTSSWLNDYAHISIKPYQGTGSRAPCDICCVVDTSGSMSSSVEIQGAKDKETCGLSQLSLVKHALKTIVYSLTENDRLSIVSFSSTVSIILNLCAMNTNGRTSAVTAIEKLSASGSTNLWGGLKAGLQVLVEGQRASGSNAALFLLTDGFPTIHPVAGYLPTLSGYKEISKFTCSINTFGFGYRLDSKLLEDLAQMGNSGSYAFIPDGSFVGTIFVNAISNLLTTTATNVHLTIGGIQLPVDPSSKYICHYSITNVPEKSSSKSYLCLHLGSVTFGQSKDVVIPISEDQYQNMTIQLDYQSPYGTKNRQCQTTMKLDGDIKSLNQQKHRLEFVHCIRQGYELLRGGNEMDRVLTDIHALKETIQDHAADDKYLTDLLTDLTGQVTEAFSRSDWFERWGIHYLPSISRAHLFQQCNNFKDPGVQHYGQGELFNTVRDEMDEIFCSLPAPKVTPRSSTASSKSGSATTVNMSAFNNSDNPCFHGSCTVKLFDGSIKLVKDIRRGDRLYPHGGIVKYVLRTICDQGQAQMVLLDSGLVITPWHPIRLAGIQWVLPCSLVPSPTNMLCEAVYSFALNEGHTIWVNNVECVTLGHGFREDVVRHVYYGSKRIIEDLRIIDGQQKCTGLIEIEPTWVMRNKRTGLVNAIQQPTRIDAITGQ